MVGVAPVRHAAVVSYSHIPAPPPRRDTAVVTAVVGLLVLVFCCGGLTFVRGLSGSSKSAEPAAVATPTTFDPLKLDDAGRAACRVFARGYRDADSKSERVELASLVAGYAAGSGTRRMISSAEALVRSADGPDSRWKLGADTFAQACLDAGWDG